MGRTALELVNARRRIKELEQQLLEARTQIEDLKAELAQAEEEATHIRGDIPSPRDFIEQNEINKTKLLEAIGLAHLPPADVWLTTVADTKSMDATIDVNHTAVLVKLPQPDSPFRREDLIAGDIIVYEALGKTIMHRIFSIEDDPGDDWGRKYRTKGDHNTRKDPWTIRDGHIKWVLVTILY